SKNLVEFTKPIKFETRIELLIQVLEALAYLHHRGIIHRDLKPDNVLVTTEGRAKMLDFGLAIAARDQADEPGEEVVGTLHYLAPEILQGRVASELSDLYAVGIMIYEIFAQRYPFRSGTIQELITDIIKGVSNIASLEIPADLQYMLNVWLSTDIEVRN